MKNAGSGKYGSDFKRILKAIDAEEKQCGILLLDNDSSAEGIIGKRVLPMGWVARKPSDIYWNGIRTFGIFKEGSLSISEYIGIATKLKSQKRDVKIGEKKNVAHKYGDIKFKKDIWSEMFEAAKAEKQGRQCIYIHSTRFLFKRGTCYR